MASIMTMEALHKTFTERRVLDGADFSMQEGEKWAIIGVNGTGKSTLLRMAAELETPERGQIVRQRNLKWRYLPQRPEFAPGERVLECVLRENRDNPDTWSLQAQARALLTELGIEDVEQPVETLSGGQKKRVALAAVLLSSADLLILDEPTNHLDGAMADWLEQYLKAFRGSVLMVTHDRYFLDSVCDHIAELEQGKIYTYPGNYERYLELRAERLEMAQASERKRQSILRKELAWIRRGAQARSTKQKGRIQRFEALSAQKAPEEAQSLSLSSVQSRLGRTTIELEQLGMQLGERLLFQDFSYIFLKNDRIGLVGPNGAGKSTLMRLIAGELNPGFGQIKRGQTVKLAYFSQENEALDETMRLIDYIRDTAEYLPTADGNISASQMLERFLFPPSQQYSLIARLSGGEKRRLFLLKLLMEAPNVLLLDEPTNDLDIQTMTVLEDYLDSFAGIVVAVSHDRYFLDRMATRIFAFEDGRLVQYEGGYTDYQQARERRMSEALEAEDSETGMAGSRAGEAGGRGAAAGKLPAESGGRAEKPKNEKLKFTYKEQKEWDSIEADIEALEDRLSALEAEMTAAARDFVRLQALSGDKAQTEALLADKLERWEYLSLLKEKIDAQNDEKV